ncbi:MAG: hypothetical protein WBF73_31375 [Bradyrhizobium sp.]
MRLAGPCDRASRYHYYREGVPNREAHHAKVDHDDSVAGPGRHFGGDCADGWFAKSSRTPSTNPDNQLVLNSAPVGHRQPRADQVPAEKNLADPNDPVNRENAALDRMIKGICRGC